jgi:hypothetical protein
MEFSRWLQNVPWIVYLTGDAVLISIVWLFHFLGFFIAVGSTVLVDLRILGLAGRNQKLTPLAAQLFPWTWIGLALAVPSGFLMFAGYAAQFYPAGAFRIKLLVFLLAIVFGALVQRNVPQWDRSGVLPGNAKLIATLSIILWIGTILASVEVPAFIACI